MNTRKTSTKIIFNVIDETAKDDAAFDAQHSPVRSWCDLDALKDGGYSGNYLTNEHNYSLLNGTLDEIDYIPPDVPTYAFVSNFSSNDSCTFDSEYYFRIIFDDFHTVPGITINFDGDFLPDKIRVVYYNSTANNHIVLNSKEFTVDENNFFCDSGGAVESFKEIRIYFLSTKFPNSLIKISKIIYGAEYVFGDGKNKNNSLLNAEIYEETDIISNTLSIDTCRFTIYSEDDDFNIDNPRNIYAAIKKHQKVEVYEIIENYDDNYQLIGEPQEIFMGQYYVKEWKAQAQNTISFECIDLIGLLDDIPFYDSRTSDSNTFGTIISWIKTASGMGNDVIQLQNGLSSKPIAGILPVCTCKEALQMACFAICGYATCARRSNIYVSIKDDTISHVIDDENNFGIINSNINPEVTGIKYQSSIFADELGGQTVFCRKDVSAGNNQTIIIDNMILPSSKNNIHRNTQQSTAVATITNVSGSTFLHAHKIVVNVTTGGLLVIDGIDSGQSRKVFVKKYSTESSNENIIDISNIYIYETYGINNYDIATLDKIFGYYSKRNTCEYEFLLTNEQTGNWCEFKNMYGDEIKGNIFSMSIDLTGGFVAKTKLVCCENLSNLRSMYFCGDELICGENSGNNIGII